MDFKADDLSKSSNLSYFHLDDPNPAISELIDKMPTLMEDV